MKAVGDLHSLARSEGLETWQNTVMPNVQHILGSVLRGVAFFHKEGYQHRDLKGNLKGRLITYKYMYAHVHILLLSRACFNPVCTITIWICKIRLI